MSDSIRDAVFQWLMTQNVTSYWVGGSVRDWALQRSGHDLDIVVDGSPIRLGRNLADKFSGAFYVLDAGREAARALLPSGAGEPFTVDLTRILDGDIYSDLAARDFTINAMALPVGVSDSNDLIDPFGGLADLAQGRLRAVAETSLRDDPLRAFRAVRMAYQFGLRVEPATESLICEAVPLLPQVSSERIRDELCRILELSPVCPPVIYLSELGLLYSVFERFGLGLAVPSARAEGHAACHSNRPSLSMELRPQRAVDALGAWESLFGDGGEPPLSVEYARALNMFRQIVERYRDSLEFRLNEAVVGHRTRKVLLKWVMLLFYIGGMACVDAVLDGLRFSNSEIRLSTTLADVFTKPAEWVVQRGVSHRDIHRFYRQARDCGPEAISFYLADRLAALGRGEIVEPPEVMAAIMDKAWWAYFEAHDEVVEPPRLVDGKIIMSKLGIPSGPQVRELLERVQEAQAEGEIHSREEALRWLDENHL